MMHFSSFCPGGMISRPPLESLVSGPPEIAQHAVLPAPHGFMPGMPEVDFIHMIPRHQFSVHQRHLLSEEEFYI
jgi:hypothetical protein